MIFIIMRSTVATVKEIIHNYADPLIKMTPFVRFSLMLLRIYLLFLVGILVYRFITALS